jgi:hypothetical protein
MAPQLLTAQDEENYGTEFLDFSRRAAYDAVGPELQQLRAQNQHLTQMARRAQRAEIERALDSAGIDWHQVYADPRFSQWLSQPDSYSGAVRSQLLRDAVAKGDAARVTAIYRGFIAESGRLPAASGQRSRQSAGAASGGPRVYSREDIRRFYEQRRLGHISDARWAQIEPAIITAANEGRIAGALDRDGNKLTELR